MPQSNAQAASRSAPSSPSPSASSPPAYRALSVRQPWAGLIVHGFKGVENRDWPTPHRGLVAIHASTNDATRDYRAFVFGETRPDHIGVNPRPKSVTATQLRKSCEFLDGPEGPTPAQLSPRGAIIGVVEIVDVIEASSNAAIRSIPSSSPGFKLNPRLWYHPWAFYAWVLANPVALAKPIPCDGKLNLWHLPPRESSLLHKSLYG